MNSHRSACTVIFAALIALACADAVPTESRPDPLSLRFALNAAAAKSFDVAIDDVRDRILPALSSADAATALAPILDDLTSSINTRDAYALRSAVARGDQFLAHLRRDDATTAAIGMELDAVRLILEDARLLAVGSSVTR
jgi:hypothetical protein